MTTPNSLLATSPLLETARRASVVLSDQAKKILRIYPSPMVDPPRTIHRLLELCRIIPVIQTDLHKFQCHDSVECGLQCWFRMVLLEYIELVLRHSLEPAPIPVLDTMADELVIARNAFVIHGTPKIRADAPITDYSIWSHPWPRSDADPTISTWIARLEDGTVEKNEPIRPFLTQAQPLLIELRQFYRLAIAA